MASLTSMACTFWAGDRSRHCDPSGAAEARNTSKYLEFQRIQTGIPVLLCAPGWATFGSERLLLTLAEKQMAIPERMNAALRLMTLVTGLAILAAPASGLAQDTETGQTSPQAEAPTEADDGLSAAGDDGLSAMDEDALSAMDPVEVARLVEERPDGEQVEQILKMQLINRRGSVRTRETLFKRKDFEDSRRQVIWFTEPSSVRGTGFLTWDYWKAGEDDLRWLYLPALGRPRRLSASERGKSFLGTDFTYEDIKVSVRFPAADYGFESDGVEPYEGEAHYVLVATPLNDKVADDLGYSRVRALVRPGIWVPMKADYWDTAGNRLKTIEVTVLEDVQGIWTPIEITARNHKTGHRTVFQLSNVDYETELSDTLFTREQLRRGF